MLGTHYRCPVTCPSFRTDISRAHVRGEAP